MGGDGEWSGILDGDSEVRVPEPAEHHNAATGISRPPPRVTGH